MKRLARPKRRPIRTADFEGHQEFGSGEKSQHVAVEDGVIRRLKVSEHAKEFPTNKRTS